MPELPEVENVKNKLTPALLGKRLSGLEVRLERIFENGEDLPLPVGQTFRAVHRLGKYLVFELDRAALIVHLGMTGQLLLGDNDLAAKHHRVIFKLASGKNLTFRDIRTFGRVILTSLGKWKTHPRIHKLGLDPIAGAAPTLENIPSRFLRSERNMKTMLLEQGFLAGVGNIYADEILHATHIHPLRKAKSLKPGDWEKVFRYTVLILRHAIASSGTTFSDYRKPDGSRGKFAKRLHVYGREGEPCHTCGSRIQKIRVAGRGTAFCASCQTKSGSLKPKTVKRAA
ncbi:MAG: DNA-formamidopyrimidine glycosylase [Spirochaetia bacterium]|nr:DNA-formamidopyrimidine glycosylase [Spirochaetia bacterium]